MEDKVDGLEKGKLISVIVPVYKVEKYIDRCIQSILKQTYYNFEIILVDDGSPDFCGRICDKYAEEYTCVKVVHQENRGLAQARKRGLQEASGRYVIFLDSDDYIDGHMLEKMYNAAVQNSSDVVVCQYTIIDDQGKKRFPVQMSEECVCCNSPLEIARQMYVTRWISPAAVAKLIAIDLAKLLVFKTNLAIGEEHDMVSQLLRYARNVSVLNAPLYFYYHRKDSISHGGYNNKYYNSFHNYLRLRNDDCDLFPELKNSIIAFYAEFEMAIMTAMCRNVKFDKVAIKELRNELKYAMKALLRNEGTKVYYKVSALMIAYVPWLFIVVFRAIYIVTGH